ncbi:MAG: hypothetical protein ACJ8AT_20640 [Hyalangium sp.]|uniref:hypothetical protein n=1 Tax=Hyalangium sp. TaxID=2028555 RepID=UPI00389A927F
MKPLPLLSLCLLVTLGVGCSNPSQENAPAPTAKTQLKKRSQALTNVSLVEVAVSPAVQAAAGGNATVRAFEISSADGSFTRDDVVAAALEQGASDPVNLPWHAGVTRDRLETLSTLRYLNNLMPAIEAEVGTGEEFQSGYYHWFQQRAEDSCGLGDLYIPVFEQSRKVYVIEATGSTEC